MPHFYNKEDGYIISTNYKVMYGTLKTQQNLCPINKRQHLKLKFAHALAYYLLVRNPYKKLESFYKDKFIIDPQNLTQQHERGWQQSQKVFFPYLNIDHNQPFNKIKDKILSVKFDQFIHLLPQVYLSESHLAPQYLIEKLSIKKFNVKLKYKKVLKIEEPETMAFLKGSLNINTDIASNSTSHVHLTKLWDNISLQIVNKLYETDFYRYAYTKNIQPNDILCS